jgi:hypothetical protein
MNDVVLELDPRSLQLPAEVQRFRSLSLPFVTQLGQELYAEFPCLQRTSPEKARRLAMLLISKQPEINAALFVAPTQNCAPEEVVTRFCQVPFEVMAMLMTRQNQGQLTNVATDREVWRRLAA